MILGCCSVWDADLGGLGLDVGQRFWGAVLYGVGILGGRNLGVLFYMGQRFGGGLLMGPGFGAVIIYGTVIWGHYSIWGGDWGVLIT